MNEFQQVEICYKYNKTTDFPLVLKPKYKDQPEPNFDEEWKLGSSNALIKMLKGAPTGSYTFTDLTNSANIKFPEVVISDKTQTAKEITASKIHVHDDRSHKEDNWEVQVKLKDDEFTSAGLKLTLKPTSASTVNHAEATILSQTASKLFKRGADKTSEDYETLLNASLEVPKDVLEKNQYKTVLEWTLGPEL